MKQVTASQPPQPLEDFPNPPPATRGVFGRIVRLAAKELKETLRDRRTVVTLVLMPLLVYPVVSLVLQRFLLTSLTPGGKANYIIAVASEEQRQRVLGTLIEGDRLIIERRKSETPSLSGQDDDATDEEAASAAKANTAGGKPATNAGEPTISFLVAPDLSNAITLGDADVAVRIHPSGGTRDDELSAHFELIHLHDGLSERAARFIEDRLRAINTELLRERLERTGVENANNPVRLTEIVIEGEGGAAAVSLGALVPLILLMMTVTGAVYPAIDLTAGERERGTLEMLVAAPVPRIGLLLAKYIAVLCVAALTASVNLLAMTVTALSIGLGPMIFGDEGLSIGAVVMVFGLMLLFAAFFSAVLLAVTSFARSFKEAQAYLIPLMLLSLAPGMAGLIPGLSLDGPLAVVPLVNVVLLSRDLFAGNAQMIPAAVVVGSTLIYAAAAIAAAARIFGTDAILYGSPGTWSDWFRRPVRTAEAPTPAAAVALVALMLPGFFLLGSLAARREGLSLEARLGSNALVTILLCGGLPLLAAWLRRVRRTAAFRLEAPGRSAARAVVAFLGAALLGVSLWPFAFEAFIFADEAGLSGVDASYLERMREVVVKLQDVSPVWIVITLGVVPGLCEEFFFRGYLLSALRTQTSNVWAVVLSAVIFGMFHVLATDALSFIRFVPTTLLGLVLGWMCVRTGSLWPGVVLHVCHNSLLSLAAHFEPVLKSRGWLVEEASHLPAGLLVTAAVVAAAGFGLVWTTRASVAQTS